MSGELKFFLKDYRSEFFLFWIVVIGMALRFYHLTTQSYWLDELYSVYFSNPVDTFTETMDKVFADRVHPPIYNILLWLWFKLFGLTEYSGRAFSAMIGSFGVLAIYFLGKELVNKHVGLYAALLAALNLFLVEYSQEVRSYALVFLMSTLSYLFLFKAIHSRRNSDLILYILVTVFLFYTHYFGFFLAASQFFVLLYFVFFHKQNLNKLIFIGQGLIALSAVPLLYLIISNMSEIESSHTDWIKAPTPFFFIEYGIRYFANKYLLIVFAALMLVLAVNLYRQRRVSNPVVYTLLIWIVVTLLLPYLQSIISSPILHIRYTMIGLPAIILLIAVAIDSIDSAKIKYLILGFIIFFSLNQLYKSQYYYRHRKEEWRQISQYLLKTNDVYPLYSDYNELYNIYFQMLHADKRALSLDQLISALENHQSPPLFWVVTGHSGVLVPKDVIEHYDLKIRLQIEGRRISGVLYEKPKDASHPVYGDAPVQ